jgi:hypothetical protein
VLALLKYIVLAASHLITPKLTYSPPFLMGVGGIVRVAPIPNNSV